MNVLLIGSGGREHALAWKLARSRDIGTLFCAPGNPGTRAVGENVALNLRDHDAVIAFCRLMAVGLVVVGPEAPLVDGLADSLRAGDVPVFGPSAAAARLEGSKGFTKELCAAHAIPTADHRLFNNAPKAKAHARSVGAPIVIKADGLAAGKGVTVAATLDEALAAIDDCFEGAHGVAGAQVVIEERLEGPEVSFFCLCDGTIALPFGSAQDHKRLGDGDTGPNTGGMGAYSPAPILSDDLQASVMATIIAPTLKGMTEMGCPFSGVLYAGLMLTADGPKLIEYNVRFGDPECQVLMARLDSDLLPILQAAAKGDLSGVQVNWSTDAAMTVVMCAPGYPGAPQKGSVIAGIARSEGVEGVTVFHAGTAERDDDLIAEGGRVLNVTARGVDTSHARARCYEAVALIDWPEGVYRRDIGWRALANG